ncbi:hypothetical protein [Paenibacillus sp. V4I7]|uniref:hypothetical protein n=1 Tax=Paenibacillus sp. V4I7 TaxID=3042307 RepID=UPI00277D460C|nr:hypothetical protein [Paenibacillus sp. V4I7]MDQ0899150.1 hypothetical protein [Paenibacillus sp. V4I7]
MGTLLSEIPMGDQLQRSIKSLGPICTAAILSGAGDLSQEVLPSNIKTLAETGTRWISVGNGEGCFRSGLAATETAFFWRQQSTFFLATYSLSRGEMVQFRYHFRSKAGMA